MANVVEVAVAAPAESDVERAKVLFGIELFLDGETLMARDAQRPELVTQVDETALAAKPFTTLGFASSDLHAQRVRKAAEHG